MKKKLILLVAVLILTSSNVATAQSQRNGNWWLSIAYSYRGAYITGLFDGKNVAETFIVNSLKNDGKQINAIDVSMVCGKLDGVFGNVTSGQLADGLSSFYSDYRNRKILVEDAIPVVIGEIDGVSEKILKESTENLRRNAK